MGWKSTKPSTYGLFERGQVGFHDALSQC